VPIGSYAELIDGELGCARWLARRMVRRWYAANGAVAGRCRALGVSLAEELLDNGARDILAVVCRRSPSMSILVTRPRPQGRVSQPPARAGTRGLEFSAH
jgi:hypothetical protein